MEKLFGIVKFIDEDDALGVIPLRWTSECEDSCRFPNIKSDATRDKLVRCQAEPEEDWQLCPISIVHKFNTYSQARLKLKKAEDTSNLDTDDEVPVVRKRRSNTQGMYPGESSDEDSVIPKKRITVSKEPPYPSLQPFKQSTLEMKNAKTCVTTTIRESSGSPSRNKTVVSGNTTSTKPPSTVLRVYTPGGENLSSPSRKTFLSDPDKLLFTQMQEAITNMAVEITSLHNKIDSLLANQETAPAQGANNEYAVFGQLPLKTTDAFDEVEQMTKNDDKFCNQFIKVFASTGGKDFKSLVTNMMRRLMTDELAEKYSYSGKTIHEVTKITFSKTKLCSAIFAAAQKIYKVEATCEKVRLVVCNWLQQAKTRKTRREQRNQIPEDVPIN